MGGRGSQGPPGDEKAENRGVKMRGVLTSPRELRRERLAGNWGSASEHIGSRWEQIGLEALHRFVGDGRSWPADGASVRKIVPLAGDDALQLALSRAGLPNPDVLVEVVTGEGAALQALDFKWNLEFASYGQIRAEATQALMQKRVKPVVALLAGELGVDPAALPAIDGLLFSPELPVNRWFLDSEQNQRQEFPLEAREVIFEGVDPLTFFGPLPGWEMAALLARIDRLEPRLQQLEAAEHYYRVGAGLQGAVAQLLVSVFVRKPPEVLPEAALDWFRSRVRPAGSQAFLQFAEKLMSARSQLTQRLRALTRSPYRFADLATALKARGYALPEGEDQLQPEERVRWGEILRKVAVEHRERIYRTGLKLAEAGLSDAEALSRIEGDRKRFVDRAVLSADRLIDAALTPE